MIAPAVTIEVKDNRTLTPEIKTLALPLLDVAGFLALEARNRLATKQTLANGQRTPRYQAWSRYLNQRAKFEAGEIKALRARKPRHAQNWDLARSGKMWRSLRVRLQTPIKATAGFYGKTQAHYSERYLVERYAEAGGMTKREARARLKAKGAIGKSSKARRTADIARIHNARLSQHILGPSPAELAEAELIVANRLAPQVARALGIHHLAFKQERRARSLERKARKHLREMQGR